MCVQVESCVDGEEAGVYLSPDPVEGLEPFPNCGSGPWHLEGMELGDLVGCQPVGLPVLLVEPLPRLLQGLSRPQLDSGRIGHHLLQLQKLCRRVHVRML